jgi:hypothetical protein
MIPLPVFLETTLLQLPLMNDRSEPGRSILGQKAGSDEQDTGNDAGSFPDGTHDEGACQDFRPRALMMIGARYTEAKHTPKESDP